MTCLNRNLIESAERGQRERKSRVFSIQADNHSFIVKSWRPPSNPILRLLTKFIFSFIKNPILRPVLQKPGFDSQEIEISRLERLRAAGIRVPMCLYRGEQFFIMENIPGTMLERDIAGDETTAIAAFEKGLEAILDAHGKGQYIGQPFVKNIIKSDNELVFIDFEEDPMSIMNLQQCQARDILLFLASCVWQREDLWTEWSGIWANCCKKISKDVLTGINSTLSNLEFLGPLPTNRKWLGRDLYAIRQLVVFLREKRSLSRE